MDTQEEQRLKVLRIGKLGFDPALYCNVAGVVAGGAHLQEVLRKASTFVTHRTTLTQQNGGLRLYRDRENKFDEFAVQVWLATSYENQQFTNLQHAGFIPRRVCMHCYKSFGGKHAENINCPYCNGNLSSFPMSWINKYLCQQYFDVGRGVWASVWWINQADPNSNWGCRLGIGLPPTQKLRPPS